MRGSRAVALAGLTFPEPGSHSLRGSVAALIREDEACSVDDVYSAIGGSIAVLGLLVVGVVGATSSSSDEAALQPAGPGRASRASSAKVDNLLRQMTVDEKLAAAAAARRRADHRRRRRAKAGVGRVQPDRPGQDRPLQHVAVEQSRLHIPILFAYDTIHGYRTIFPIPLGAASSFDPSVATADDTIAARETATVGIKQIYSPMVDVSHEPRWGRIAEGAGEDPYLGSVFAAAA